LTRWPGSGHFSHSTGPGLIPADGTYVHVGSIYLALPSVSLCPLSMPLDRIPYWSITGATPASFSVYSMR
jgi:hypothetical protein